MLRNHLKTQVLIFIMIFMGVQAFSQDNNLKFAPFKLSPLPLPSALQFGYERVIGEQSTIGLTTKLFIPQSLDNRNLDFENNAQVVATGNFQSGKFSGFVITPELRYYTSRKSEAPNGFYLAPFLRYFNYGITGDFEYRPENGEENSLIDATINTSGLGGGFGIGVQKVWDSGFLIDWNAGLGIAVTGGRIKGEIDGPVNADIPDFVEQVADAVSLIPLVNARFTNEGDGLNARATGLPWPIVKTQLAIGYAF